MSEISSPSKIDVSIGNREHLEACLHIGESLPEYFDEAGLKEMWRSLSSDILYVAAGQGRIVGFATISGENNEKAEITWLAVSPKRQGKGIGRVLMARIEEDLIKKGVKLLTVKTLAEEAEYPPFDATRRFYERSGFLHVETINPYPGWEGDPAAIYVKPLSSNEAMCSRRK